jgi:hypothetical protein
MEFFPRGMHATKVTIETVLHTWEKEMHADGSFKKVAKKLKIQNAFVRVENVESQIVKF